MSQKITYRNAENEFISELFIDGSKPGPRPGVLVLPTFKGAGDLETAAARRLAALGYAALAVDIYGGGRSTSDPDQARSWMGELNADRPRLLRHVEAALGALRAHEAVDAGRTAAIGFCFGGKCALDLARSGSDVSAVVSLHGVYDPPPETTDNDWKAKVLVLHGWDDPLAPPDATIGLAREMTARGADWQILAFGHTGHAFTNPAANAPEQGLFYKESSDRRAWAAMISFLAESFV